MKIYFLVVTYNRKSQFINLIKSIPKSWDDVEIVVNVYCNGQAELEYVRGVIDDKFDLGFTLNIFGSIENIGKTSALNVLLESLPSSFDYCAFIDDDDQLSINNFSHVLKILKKPSSKGKILVFESESGSGVVEQIPCGVYDMFSVDGKKFCNTDKLIFIPNTGVRNYRFPTPLFLEKFCPEDALFLVFTQNLKITYFNIVSIIKNYEPSGLTANYVKTINSNPYSMIYYHAIRHIYLPNSKKNHIKFFLAINKYILIAIFKNLKLRL
ncbi:glycosyltransferase family 2 protein [Polynucleobacter yangtzensis]|uniref:glycosyltransferase family 2 protein n=1 Tax=Polynucleobacter yangtzensis TaxID=1743159 RepID=UPI00082F56AC|nr:glycosyltransferase family A protein [Polynucleobacter yangtzensis]